MKTVNIWILTFAITTQVVTNGAALPKYTPLAVTAIIPWILEILNKQKRVIRRKTISAVIFVKALKVKGGITRTVPYRTFVTQTVAPQFEGPLAIS